MCVTHIGQHSGAGRGPLIRRSLVAVLAPAVLVATALGAAGCDLLGRRSPAPVTTTSASPDVSATTTPTTPVITATPTTDEPLSLEFRTDGAGPYEMGQTLAQLQSGPGLDEVGPMDGCPGNTSARGVGMWRDVSFSFHSDGRLYLLVNRSTSIPTPSGVWLGTKADQVRTIYSGLVTYNLTRGSSAAVVVQTLSGAGILFELNERDEVTAMYSGPSSYLRAKFTAGTPYC